MDNNLLKIINILEKLEKANQVDHQFDIILER